MPYIIVRSVMIPAARKAFQLTTIEGAICENTMMQLGAAFSNDGSRSYKTTQPPYEVLNVLETEGYKVVGTNTIGPLSDTSHNLIWTLHKQA